MLGVLDFEFSAFDWCVAGRRVVVSIHSICFFVDMFLNETPNAWPGGVSCASYFLHSIRSLLDTERSIRSLLDTELSIDALIGADGRTMKRATNHGAV